MKSVDFKSIFVWTLFCIALTQLLGLMISGDIIMYVFFPGLLFYLFVFYYRFRTGDYIPFRNFLLSVFCISILFFVTEILNYSFVQRNFRNEDEVSGFIIEGILSIFFASFLYLVGWLICKLRRA